MKIIKVGAAWCNGCLVMKPRWAEIEAENPWLQTEYYDFDQDREKITKYHINSGTLPVFIFLDEHDQEIDRLTGEIDKDELNLLIQKNKQK